MGFFEVYEDYKDFAFAEYLDSVTDKDVIGVLHKHNLTEWDLLTLLAPRARAHLETMAQKAHQLTVGNFGRVMLLYTPIYLADYCVNQCVYCGFNVTNKFRRKKLSLEDLDGEARTIAQTQLNHILILTGESRTHTPPQYIRDCVRVLNKHFHSISIEIYPLDVNEYEELVNTGVDGLTIYQEVYNQDVYDQLHVSGPKKDYLYRLDAPQRGCQAGMRTVGLGALLGLDDWRKEAFFTGLHAQYLERQYADVEFSLSLPRIRPHMGSFQARSPVDDVSFVQILTALRLFLPRVGINISTREETGFRDNLLTLGVTKMSAGVSTEVGGHGTVQNGVGQFEIGDGRSVAQIRDMLLSKGYQPIFKDWHRGD